jgi:hypothetical protein
VACAGHVIEEMRRFVRVVMFGTRTSGRRSTWWLGAETVVALATGMLGRRSKMRSKLCPLLLANDNEFI